VYYDKIYKFVLRRVSKPEVAEDLTGDIFEKVYKKIHDFQWQGITVIAWIYRIARNRVIDYYRKNNKRKTNVALADVANYVVSATLNVEVEIQADEEEQALFNAIGELEETDQYLVYYKFFESMSNKEISKLTGLTETNIGTKLFRIRKKIGKIIKKK